MKKILLISVLLMASVSLFSQTQARVIRVKDADTYVLKVNAKTLTVRLNNVDAPEMNQAWGIKAAKNVSNLILGKMVDYDSTGKDRYGRVLVNINIEGNPLDEILVENGWAWEYLQYSINEKLHDLQVNAIKKGNGLWYCGVTKVCPPWIFRSYNKLYRAKYCKGCK